MPNTAHGSCGRRTDKGCDAAPTSAASQNGWTWHGLARPWGDKYLHISIQMFIYTCVYMYIYIYIYKIRVFDVVEVPDGKAQGTVLGPILFISYVNDLFNCTE